MGNNYSYSAKDAEEAKKIRKEFSVGEKSDLDILRDIQAGIKKKASIPSMIVGIISALIFGVGMCFTMVYTKFFILGIIIGIIGIIGMAGSYFIYVKVLASEKRKHESEVNKLADNIISGTVTRV